MIDLHTHTTASDGTYAPQALVDAAVARGIRVLAITDHDTLSGFDSVETASLTLVCGIELSVKFHGRSTHVLGYFPDGPAPGFREGIREIQEGRRDRNRRLAARLEQLGVDITLDEVQAIGGTMTGRPHFARVLMNKGYATSIQDAFDKYLDERAAGYVYREEPLFAEGVRLIRENGGIASLAHPVRVKGDIHVLLPEMCTAGLNAIEVYHSDHSPELTLELADLAKRYGLLVTGGSDFHGDTKPGLQLGVGRGDLEIPPDLWDRIIDAYR